MDSSMFVFVLVAGIIAGGALIALMIWLWYKISYEFYSIAVQKGHDQKKYFWWTFFFGIVGMLMVIALPTVETERKRQRTVVSDELPDL